jgi:hypothetical protein
VVEIPLITMLSVFNAVLSKTNLPSKRIKASLGGTIPPLITSVISVDIPD